MISTSDSCLLMVEPRGAPTIPVVDRLTRVVTAALRTGSDSGRRYRGVHSCTGLGCDAMSDNTDHYVMMFDGSTAFETNSLAVHYVACHRDEISAEELVKIELLPPVEAHPTYDELQSVVPPIHRASEAGPQILRGSLTLDGVTYYDATVGDWQTGYCATPVAAESRAMKYAAGLEVSSMPSGQASVDEMAALVDVIPDPGRAMLLDAVRCGPGSFEWLRASRVIARALYAPAVVAAIDAIPHRRLVRRGDNGPVRVVRRKSDGAVES